MRHVVLFGLVALLPLVAACAGAATAPAKPTAAAGAAGAGAAQQLTVKGLDTMKFEPNTLTAKAGQPIVVTFQNGGQIVHDFTIEQGVPQRIHVLAQPGKSVSTPPFTISKPGSYTFFCSQPGHEAAGMKGTLTVQ